MKHGLGQAIINGIVRDGLVRADSPGLCVWQANAAETLEAIVADWQANARACARCGLHVLLGEGDPFVCCDCLPPESPV